MKKIVALSLFFAVSCTPHQDSSLGGGTSAPMLSASSTVSASPSGTSAVSASPSASVAAPAPAGSLSLNDCACSQLYDEVEQACYGPTNCMCCEGMSDAGFSSGGSGTCCSH